MSIAISQDENNATTGGGTIISITAGLLVTTAGLTSPAVGDIVQITGSSTTANNSRFTITAIVVANTQVQLSPAPVDQGASGSARRLNRTTTLYPALAPAAFSTVGGVNFITGGGAQNFITSGVNRGDRVIIAGGGQNQGAVYVREVLSATLIAVDTVGGTGWATGVITTETVAVRQGQHRVITLDEAATDWAGIIASGTLAQGAGVAGDPTCLRRRTVVTSTAGQQRFIVELHGISRVVLTQSSSSTSTVFASSDEVVSPMKLPVGGTGTAINYRIDAPAPSGVSVVSLGTNPNGDRHSVATGSAWTGIVPNSADLSVRLILHRYGSYWDPSDVAVDTPGTGADLLASILKSRFDGSVSMRIESPIIYSKTSAAIVPLFALTDANNVLLTASVLAGLTFFAGSITGILISDSITLPLLQLAGTPAVFDFDDPREDYAMSDLAVGTTGIPTGRKRYTFNPRFVKSSPTGATADPIENLTVEVYSVNETTDIATLVFGPALSDVNGRINGGAGILFVRAQTVGTPGTVTEFTTQIIVRGPGYRTTNRKLQLTERTTGDISIQLLADNLENEVSAL